MNKKVVGGVTVGMCMLGVFMVLRAGPMGNMLRQKQQELAENRGLILKTEQSLAQAHQDFNSQLINGINNLVNGTINNFINTVQGSANAIKEVPQEVLNLAGIGDIVTAIGDIDSVLKAVRTLLVDTRDRFAPIVAQLDTTTDPKSIYKDFRGVVADMDASLVQMDKMQKFLDAMDM